MTGSSGSSPHPDPEFWSGQRVFLTGHTGFKGSWLGLMLEQLGAQVHGYALQALPDCDLASVPRYERSVHGDVRDQSALRTAMQDARPSVVLHLAAQPLVRRSYADPRETMETNVIGTMNVLEAVREMESVRAVVVVTTDKCYHNREWDWGYRESEALGGRDPYSASKACTELVTAAWRSSFFGDEGVDSRATQVASARAGNVIGGGDVSEDRLVPDVIRSLTRGETIVLRNPLAVRPWQHVLEPLHGYLRLAEALCGEQGATFADAFNFGPTDADCRPVGEVVDLLCERWGTGHCEHDQSVQPHEAHLLKLDSSRARNRLGWKTRWSLANAIDEIVVWEQARQQGHDLRESSLESLRRYRCA